MNLNLTIRKLRDCPAVISSLPKWFVDGFAHEEVREDEELSWLQKSLCSFATLPVTFVAFDGSIPIGTARIFENEMADRPHYNPWFAYCYVLPEYRNQGVARSLYNERMNYCLRNRIDQPYLYTSVLEAAYLKRGWEVIERRTWFSREVAILRARPGFNN